MPLLQFYVPKMLWYLILAVTCFILTVSAGKYDFGYTECTYNPYKFKCMGEKINIFQMERYGLTNFPERNIGPSITCVKLKSNKIERFPKDLSKLKSITSLDLSNNRIKELPVNLKDMSNLEILDLSNNGITQMSTITKYPPSLRGLILADNQLTSLPMLEIPGLFVLDLSSNQFTEIPPTFCVSKELIRVDVTKNPLAGDIATYTDTVNYCRNTHEIQFCLFVDKPEIACECESLVPLIHFEPNFYLGSMVRGAKFMCNKESDQNYVGIKVSKITKENVTSTCNLLKAAPSSSQRLLMSTFVIALAVIMLFIS